MQTKLTDWLRSFGASALNVWSWSRIKLERITRKVYLMEKAAAFRDDYRRCRHFTFVFYDEFHNNMQTRRDYLTQARLAKANMKLARRKLAAAEAIFSTTEKHALALMIGLLVLSVTLYAKLG